MNPRVLVLSRRTILSRKLVQPTLYSLEHQLFATEGYAIEIDLLRVYRAEEAHWHASIGKNTAHMQAGRMG